ncbi:helix-turn-helix domain-containing protein [Tropicimonas sp. IMCC34011]|uniref:helix-turn-helix domain-containing protein n=1 Tax=Tropicimonas sp. IMCC34011 TaxID=2248759 RepID=UPI000E24E830|nr:helix-turn-helix domain-containing protein [Tropicimonas sp. IMCC34011]
MIITAKDEDDLRKKWMAGIPSEFRFRGWPSTVRRASESKSIRRALQALEAASEPLSVREVARIIGRNRGTARTVLVRLVSDGRAVSSEREYSKNVFITVYARAKR